ncbi:MAG TPA: phosphatase PAP2 family protein [Candidatus Dormibacteraeota bacterium]|nr:phosphatase PAP2 family protein [Candidatus Dormibacteraeota bacterium]
MRASRRHPRLFALLVAWLATSLLLGLSGHLPLTAEFFGLLVITLYLAAGPDRDFAWPFAAWFAGMVLLDQLGMLAFLGGAPHAADVIALERRLFGGDTVIALQDAWHRSTVQWWDDVLTFVYWMHSYAPVLLGMALWRWRRSLFRPFVASLLVGGAIAAVVYVAFPETPPWLAGIRGQLPPVHRVAAEVMGQSHWMYSPWYGTGDRPEGAMPSMHVAVSMLVAFWAIRAFSWRAAATVLYPMAMSVAVVYLGEHYAVDALGGAIVDAMAVGGAIALERRLGGSVARAGRLVYSPAHT